MKRLKIFGIEITIDFQNIETEGNEDLFRYSHSAVIYQDTLWVFGGADKQRKSTNDLWKLDLGKKFFEKENRFTEKTFSE